MRKAALEVGKDYALWRGHGSYGSAQGTRGFGGIPHRWVTQVDRIRIVSLSQETEVPAGRHTSSKMTVRMIACEVIGDDGKPTGETRMLRDGGRILAPWREWYSSVKDYRDANRKAAAKSARREARENEVVDLFRRLLGDDFEGDRIKAYRHHRDDGKFSVQIDGVSLRKLRKAARDA